MKLREIVQPDSDPDLFNRRKHIMHISDMVMHVDEKLGENTRRNVERTLTAHKGVIHAHFNEKRPHLMLVSYDPKRTSSFDILAKMTNQHLGAERIG
ncbi:MAG: ATP-binding protein [Gammaproteobacteria bacterium]|nr:MAG: ATP-binding protein [Gammaproteobacteria bacterium]